MSISGKRAAVLALGLGAIWGATRALRQASSISFRGKTIVIMGGSRGLGLELARRWAAEGARVALCARSSDDIDWAGAELRRFGTEVFGQPCDVSRQEDVNRFIHEVE